MDNCGNSRANTCAQARLRRRVVFIRYRVVRIIFGSLVSLSF